MNNEMEGAKLKEDAEKALSTTAAVQEEKTSSPTAAVQPEKGLTPAEAVQIESIRAELSKHNNETQITLDKIAREKTKYRVNGDKRKAFYKLSSIVGPFIVMAGLVGWKADKIESYLKASLNTEEKIAQIESDGRSKIAEFDKDARIKEAEAKAKTPCCTAPKQIQPAAKPSATVQQPTAAPVSGAFIYQPAASAPNNVGSPSGNASEQGTATIVNNIISNPDYPVSDAELPEVLVFLGRNPGYCDRIHDDFFWHVYNYYPEHYHRHVPSHIQRRHQDNHYDRYGTYRPDRVNSRPSRNNGGTKPGDRPGGGNIGGIPTDNGNIPGNRPRGGNTGGIGTGDGNIGSINTGDRSSGGTIGSINTGDGSGSGSTGGIRTVTPRGGSIGGTGADYRSGGSNNRPSISPSRSSGSGPSINYGTSRPSGSSNRPSISPSRSSGSSGSIGPGRGSGKLGTFSGPSGNNGKRVQSRGGRGK